MINNFLKKKETYLIFFWVLLWLSINGHIAYLEYYNKNFLGKVYFLRTLIPIILTIVFSTIILILFIKKIFLKNSKIFYNQTLFLFFTYYILQIIGFYQNKHLHDDLNNLYIITLCLGSLTIFALTFFLNLEKLLKYYLFIALILIVIITIISFGSRITQINFENLNLYKSFNDFSENFIGEPNQRILGLSRMLALINLAVIVVVISRKKINKVAAIIFIMISTLLIFIMQSRGTIICFFLSSLFLYIFLVKYLDYKKILYSILFLLFLFATIEVFFSKTGLTENNIYKNRIFTVQDTSGRISLWKKAIKVYDTKEIFGYGPQADRILLNNTEVSKYYGNNVSNAIVYSFLCGGYLSMILFILLYLKIIYLFSKIIKYKEKILAQENIALKISLSYLIFFVIRSFVENSFAVFGVDFLLTLVSLVISEESVRKIKYINRK
jgi:O-antigen ligase